MFANPFDGARAKLARAKDHLRELASIETVYSKNQQFTVETEKLPDGSTRIVAVIDTGPPVRAAAIAADAIVNLRSTLDISVLQACIMRGTNDRRLLNKTYFAFGGDERDWDCNLNNRMAGADAVIRAAVKKWKPWKTNGNALLYALSKLAADDKHTQLMPVATRASELVIEGLSVKNPDGKLSKISGTMENWGKSNRVEIFTVAAPAEVKIAGPNIIKPILGFGEVYALTGKPVIRTINEMGAMCESIIDAIEAAART